MKDILAAWTFDTIKSDPRLYGGDEGNPAIILQYLKEASPSDSITLITQETISNAVTVSRMKNKILLEFPGYDYREKNQPKPRSVLHPNQGVLFDLRDYMTQDEVRIADFLNSNSDRWNWSPSRVVKSIRGVDKESVECILKHKKLYQLETNKTNNIGVDSSSGETNAFA